MSRNQQYKWGIRFLIFIFTIIIWWAISARYPSTPPPGKVFIDVFNLFLGGILIDIAISAYRVVVALAISFIAGGFIGLLSVRIPILNLVLESTIIPLIEALPPLTWTIVCVLIMGLGEITVIFVICVILLQFFVVSTVQGYENIDKNLSEMARSFPLGYMNGEEISFPSRVAIFYFVELGMLMPYLITATRLAYGVAWKVIIIAELFGASEGIGYLINQAYSTLNITRLISLSLLIVFFFLIGDHLFLRRLEGKVWRQKESL